MNVAEMKRGGKLKSRIFLLLIMSLFLSCGNLFSQDKNKSTTAKEEKTASTGQKSTAKKESKDSVAVDNSRYETLTEEDFKRVADQLGVEVAAIKAVVQIEAGAAMKGFLAPGVPVINFDASMWAIYKNKAPNKEGNKNAKVPAGLSGYGLKEWTQLTNHRKINAQGADMSTFWGMFQIGGFNYKTCGCESVDEFVRRMSESELEQLELFAIFLEKTGMVADLRAKKWAAFARRYNGASYAKRRYHTRMEAAYNKFKKQ